MIKIGVGCVDKVRRSLGSPPGAKLPVGRYPKLKRSTIGLIFSSNFCIFMCSLYTVTTVWANGNG